MGEQMLAVDVPAHEPRRVALVHAQQVVQDEHLSIGRRARPDPDRRDLESFGHARRNQCGNGLEHDGEAARRLERLVAWRCRTLALPYGDQGLLLHRDLLRAVGGIRALPLMEDVDLIRRLGRHRLIGLDIPATTSAAKWQRDGWYRRSARNLACLALYFGGLPPRLIARLY